ncbi:MAG TPA: diguanylate cyclase [Candidatus Limnocylindrales bacterium]|nr:diguanylate cyclase [Candidatus Limnocylindrales bacterium]
MDQVTAVALTIALVVNLVVLVAALAWARRQRELPHPTPIDPHAGRGIARPAVAGSGGAAGPWWRDGVEGVDAAASGSAAAVTLESDVAPPSDASLAPSERGQDVLHALEDAATWRGLVAAEVARVVRYGHAATVVIADLEGLDRLASRLGPESVERLTAAVADTIRRQARATDRVGRLAPARFAILLPETDEVASINWVERVREATDLWLEASAVALRLAFGWAELRPDADVDAALDLARTRLEEERRRARGGRSTLAMDSGRVGRGANGRRSTSDRDAARETRPSPLPGAAGSSRPGPSGSPLAAG